MPPHLERVRSEKNELDGRIRDLEMFLERDTLPKSVTPQEFDVMQRQLMVMDALSQILAERLEIGKKAHA